MPDLPGFARRLLHRLAAPQPQAGETDPGTPVAADGNHAVAVTEAWISDAAAVGASFPAAAASGAFLREAAEAANLFGRPVEAVEATSPRGALAAALGLAEAGRRAAVFLAGPDLAAAEDLLARAVERRLPLVVHLVCRAGAGPGSALGGGHEALAAAAARGALTLVAANVQEAVDFALIGRRVAEETLTPVVVAMDGAETALAVQDLYLPSAELVRRFLGDPEETVHPTTAAQEQLWGRHRRRLPRGHDPGRPVLSGAALGPEAHAPAALGRRLYFDRHVPERFVAACELFAELTGRRHAAVSAHHMEKAQLVLLTVGSAVETAEAAADRLREEGLAVGVLGVRCLAPFPADRLAELAGGRSGKAPGIAVLERLVPPPEGEGPLASRVRSALGRVRESAGDGRSREPRAPRVACVVAGFGGLPLGGGELAALARTLLENWRPGVFLGIDALPASSSYPKRQALLDALRRDYPEAEGLGLTAASPAPDLRPAGAVTFAFAGRGTAGGAFRGLPQEAAVLLHRAAGGHLRARPAPSPFPGWSTGDGLDRVTWSKVPLRDTGDAPPTEVMVWTSPGSAPAGAVTAAVEGLAPELAAERLLGALLGALEARGSLAVSHRKLLDARKEMLAEAGVAAEERQVRLDHFTAGLDGAVPAAAAGPESAPAEPEIPALVRRLGRSDTRLDSLPRFWDHVGVLYRHGETAQLSPDPYLAAGAVPPLSAALRSFAGERTMLPAFDPAPCTGCGACWTACPHGALEPAVVGAEALLAAGMARAKENGASVEPLRQVLGRLASRMNQELAKKDGEPGVAAGALLERSFAAVIEKMPLPEERKTAIAEAFAPVRDALADLPLARTEPFFDTSETAAKGSGELFTLAVDADACKACGLCVAVCEPEALTALADSPERTAAARALARQVAELPAPQPETLERARAHPEVGPLAGALLDPAARRWVSGGDSSEAGSGEALAVRQLLGAAAFHLAPRREEQLSSLAELQEKLAAAIHEEMADALPAKDLDALARGLDAFDRPDAGLTELTARVETAFESERVDVVRLRRLVAVAKEVADLAQRVETGEGGLGRAPFGLVVGPGPALAWAGAFPWNPFAVPVTVDACGETADLARGLAAGALQAAVEEARLLRRARLEVARPAEAARAGRGERLALADLTEAERRACPPLFVLVREDAAGAEGGGLAGLLDLLATELPVKVVLLTAADPVVPPRVEAGLLALTAWQRGTSRPAVAQTSVSAFDHLEGAVAAALATEGPALVRVHAPSPAEGGFAPEATLERARAALETGHFPLYLARPGAPGEEASPLDLSGNPELGEETLASLPPAHRATWRLLRRLAEGEGAGEAPSAASSEEVAALEERHRAEVAQLTAHYEGRLASLAAELRLETARKVRGRLLELVRRGAGRPAAEEGDGEDATR